MRSPPRDALIADVTPPPLIGRAFGLQRGLDHVGAVIGPLIAWIVLSRGADLRTVIVASVAPGIVAVLLAMWAVRDHRRETAGTGAAGAVSEPEIHTGRAVSRLSAPFSVIAISLFYLIRIPETLMILRAQNLGIAVALIPLLWAALHVVRSSTSFVGGSLSDRIGPARTMWIGWIAYVLLAVGMGLAGSRLAAWLLFLALGVVAGLTESPERSLVSAATGGHRGSGFGVYHGLTGIAALAGGIALGLVYQRASGATAFLVSAAGASALAILWPFWIRSHRVPPQ
jgi:MFS family permease